MTTRTLLSTLDSLHAITQHYIYTNYHPLSSTSSVKSSPPHLLTLTGKAHLLFSREPELGLSENRGGHNFGTLFFEKERKKRANPGSKL